jgi:uncharacterized protein (TIGR00730 family)
VKSLAVYCGSSPGADPIYRTAAVELGKVLAKRDITVIYGGGHVGLMGAVADSTIAAGGKVVGVITKHLLDKEVGHGGLTELRVVETMHERKAIMADLAGAFVALPGSLGTLEEIAEVMVATQLGLHHKACGILNTNGYYDPLIAQIDRMVTERFMHGEHREGLIVATEPVDLVERMAKAEVVYHDKWVDRGGSN